MSCADASVHSCSRVSARQRDTAFQVRISFKVCVGGSPFLFSSEMRSFFQAIAKNFLQERSNVNLDSFYSTSYYQIKYFSLVVFSPLPHPRTCGSSSSSTSSVGNSRFSRPLSPSLQKQSLRPSDPLAEQQEHSLLEFWNSYLPPALYPRIFADYLRLSVPFPAHSHESASSELSALLQQTLEESRYRLQSLYVVPVLLYLNPPFMQLARRLLAFLDRLCVLALSLTPEGKPCTASPSPSSTRPPETPRSRPRRFTAVSWRDPWIATARSRRLPALPRPAGSRSRPRRTPRCCDGWAGNCCCSRSGVRTAARGGAAGIWRWWTS